MKIDISQFQRDSFFYGELNLLLTVKSLIYKRFANATWLPKNIIELEVLNEENQLWAALFQYL